MLLNLINYLIRIYVNLDKLKGRLGTEVLVFVFELD